MLLDRASPSRFIARLDVPILVTYEVELDLADVLLSS